MNRAEADACRGATPSHASRRRWGDWYWYSATGDCHPSPRSRRPAAYRQMHQSCWARVCCLERDHFRWDRHRALDLWWEHDLFGKPVSTFPDHARMGPRTGYIRELRLSNDGRVRCKRHGPPPSDETPNVLVDLARYGLACAAILPLKKATTAALNSRWKAARSSPAGSRQISGTLSAKADVHGARNAKWPAFATA